MLKLHCTFTTFHSNEVFSAVINNCSNPKKKKKNRKNESEIKAIILMRL